MLFPRRPKELRTTLRRHAGRADAPVFVYRFPSPEEEAAQMFRTVEELQGDPAAMSKLDGLTGEALQAELERLVLAGELKTQSRADVLCALFDRQLITIENLEFPVGSPSAECRITEVFDRDRHLADIPGAWKIEVGIEIEQRIRSYLSDAEEGNSSSPSSSGDGSAALTPSTADVEVGA